MLGRIIQRCPGINNVDSATIQRLNAINRDFYRTSADAFDQTRGRPWPGWITLMQHIDSPGRVLDLGCGNGRFGVFLADSLESPLVYHGIDNNAHLLQRAAADLNTRDSLTVQLEALDIIENPLPTPESPYDLIALFGVMHHVPGDNTRKRLLRQLAGMLAPGGVLVYACWRFYEFERFRERIVPWPDDLKGRVETHDYLLDWRRGETAYRYCHYVDDDENADLIAATRLNPLATYRADGFNGQANLYTLLKSPT